MGHPRNVGWGEMGLDYHYDNSPRDVQREVFKRQLQHAVRLQKPLTIHTREAEEDRRCGLSWPRRYGGRSIHRLVLGPR